MNSQIGFDNGAFDKTPIEYRALAAVHGIGLHESIAVDRANPKEQTT